MLEEKNLEILLKIVNHPNITTKEIVDSLNINENQLAYSITKINEYLRINGYKAIEKSEKGNMFTDVSVKKVFASINVSNMHLSRTERIPLIIISIIHNVEDVSLLFLSHKLNVSRNTILRDLTIIEERLKNKDLRLLYSRETGYQIVGDELEIRKVLEVAIIDIYDWTLGLEILENFTVRNEINFDDIAYKLRLVERELGVLFSDEKFKVLTYFIYFILYRIKDGYILKSSGEEFELALSSLDEFKQIVSILDIEETQLSEQSFIAVELLGSKLISVETTSESISYDLKQVIETCLKDFKALTAFSFKDERQLIQNLLYHLTPVYFKLKYLKNQTYIEDEIEFYEQYRQEYKYLDYVVKNTFEPLVEFLEQPLPTYEWMFISLIVGSNILDTKQKKDSEKYTAIVLCPKGITYSLIVQNKLSKLFPELKFYEPTSYRNYQKSKLKADVVFSLDRMIHEDNWYKVESKMSQQEKKRLRSRVLKMLENITLIEDQDNRLIDEIINKLIPNANNLEKDVIENKLSQLLSNYTISTKKPNKSVLEMKLKDILILENIKLVDSVKDYEEALSLAATPLLDSKAITPNYVEYIIKTHDYDNPYIVLENGIAIPHAQPEKGVREFALSLLVVKEGVNISSKDLVSIIFLLAPPGTGMHNEVIIDILKISESKEISTAILSAKNEIEIKNIIERLEEYE